MTEEEIIQIWNSIPPQGDPTGKKFAQEIERKVLQGLEYDVESAIQDLIKISERNQIS